MKKLLFLSFLSLLSINTKAQIKEDIKMFPNPNKDEHQKVIRLDPKENEENYMVEILVGKKTITDGCNNYFLAGNIDIKDLDGWGYNYYKFETNGTIGSTLMGCINSKSVEKIVYAPSQKLRYNSRLPIVIYTPKGYEVNYRIWSASDKILAAE